MTPKEEAKQIVDKFSPYVDYAECGLLSEREMIIKNSKQCALIHVEGLIRQMSIFATSFDALRLQTHLKEVKKEIQAI